MKDVFNKKLGFGFLHLPHIDPNDSSDVDVNTVNQMVDTFLARGFTYFDTAYTYLNKKSEEFLRKCLVERHPRETFAIATKLPCYLVKDGLTAEDIFAEQLERCGVDYFDVYLLHGIDGEDAASAEKKGCFDFLEDLKKTGRARLTGFSYHGTAPDLDNILTRHPEVDVVQIQLNYLDWDNEIIQSRANWEVCRRHNKPIIVMEPIKGGTLSNLPESALPLLNGETPSSRAIRFAASQEGVALVLSGMSTLAQLDENTAFMADFKPLTTPETQVLTEIADIVRANVAIPCTACSYCTSGCPMNIPIPKYFSLYNEKKRDGWQVDADSRYKALAETFGKAADCISCGQCESACPQKLPIIEHLKTVSKSFDK